MILEEFNPSIMHIAREKNIAADALSHLPWTDHEEEEYSTCNIHPLEKELFNLEEEPQSSNDGMCPLQLDLIHQAQQQELDTTRLKTLVRDKNSGYSQQNIEGTDMIMYNKKLYIPKNLCRCTINWYHHFLCHPGGDRLAKP